MELIPNAGLSLISLSRGVFGMFFLIFIAYLFSNNRKAIVWKTVGIGLIIQVFIAIGVLKINFVKGLFETIGGFFIKVLEYTGEGTKMLLGEFGNTETYGFIFVFQALPVIIFFSALLLLHINCNWFWPPTVDKSGILYFKKFPETKIKYIINDINPTTKKFLFILKSHIKKIEIKQYIIPNE